MEDNRNYIPNGNIRDTQASLSFIVIDKPQIRDGKLIFKLSLSNDLKKYILSDQIEFQYNENISTVPPGILYIPALSSLICVAWAVGADVFLQTIDREYLCSLEDVKKEFVKWFPQFSFSTRIQAETISDDHYDNDRSALLFSGGLDSLTSLIRNRDKKPILICIWGASHPFPENKSFKKRKQWEDNFIQRNTERLKTCFVSTNVGNVINDRLLANRYINDQLKSDDWWETVSHGLTYTGLTAPVTFVEGIADLLMASSSSKKDDQPNGSHVFFSAHMKWAQTRVVYDSADLCRQDKIRLFFAGNTQFYNNLQVCDVIREKRYNCGLCEKCLRTIIGLIMENIDPNECNFHIHDGILEYIRTCLQNGLLRIGYEQICFWEEIQAYIKNRKPNTTYNANDFFEWYKDFDLSAYKVRDRSPSQLAKRLFYLYKYDPVIAFREFCKFSPSVFSWFMKKILRVTAII